MDFIKGVLQSFAGTPEPTDAYHYFLACLVCDGISSCMQTGQTIVDEIDPTTMDKSVFPPKALTIMGVGFINSLTKSIIVNGSPNWEAVDSLPTDNAVVALQIFGIIQKGIESIPDMDMVISKIQERDRQYFSDNISVVFDSLPSMLKGYMSQSKSIIMCDHVNEESRELIWKLLENVFNLIHNRQDILEKLVDAHAEA